MGTEILRTRRPQAEGHAVVMLGGGEEGPERGMEGKSIEPRLRPAPDCSTRSPGSIWSTKAEAGWRCTAVRAQTGTICPTLPTRHGLRNNLSLKVGRLPSHKLIKVTGSHMSLGVQ